MHEKDWAMHSCICARVLGWSHGTFCPPTMSEIRYFDLGNIQDFFDFWSLSFQAILAKFLAPFSVFQTALKSDYQVRTSIPFVPRPPRTPFGLFFPISARFILYSISSTLPLSSSRPAPLLITVRLWYWLMHIAVREVLSRVLTPFASLYGKSHACYR